MTNAFQASLLKFIFQDVRAKKYIKLLDDTIFDLPAHQQLFSVLTDYIDKYGTVPSKTNYLEYLDRQVRKSKANIPDEIYSSWKREVTAAYARWDGDTSFVEEVIIEEIQKKKTKALFAEYAGKIKGAESDLFDMIHAEMAKISRIKRDGLNLAARKGRYLVSEMFKHHDTQAKGTPIVFDAINAMTAAGGFYSPQSIVLLAGPKFFKTGVLLNIAIGLVKSGKKVLYVDSENGEANIAARLKQTLLACTRSDIPKYRTELKAIVKLIEALGGELRIEFFGKDSTLADVEMKIDELYFEDNFKPDAIIYDYLDLYKSSDKSRRGQDKRLHIQDVYHEAVRLNEKYNTFSFTVSTVKANAINKMVIDVQDFGEDSQKAYNCHASFAICRTKTEMREGTARIVPVVQREGVQYRGDYSSICCLQFDEARMQIKELDTETYMDAMGEELRQDSIDAAAQYQKRKFKALTDD